MNSNSFISLKIGQKLLFTHPLSQLSQINSSFSEKKVKEIKYDNLDVLPNFIVDQQMNEINKEKSKRLINKRIIFDKIKNTYFSKSCHNFSDNLSKIENDINVLQKSIDKANNYDYKKFKEMITIINNNKTNEKIKIMQKINVKDYKNIDNETKNDIMNSILLNKNIFVQKLGLNKSNLNINIPKPMTRINKPTITIDSNNNNNLQLNTENDIINKNKKINPIQNHINDNKNYNTEPNNNNQNTIKYISNEQIELFKTFVGNNKLSNNIISSYFDLYNPKVINAADKYFKSKYGSEYITLNFVYPIKPGRRQHRFKYISEIKELFMAVENDTISMTNPKLILENGKELLNNRKFKCIGALNLNNNSIIKVFKQ